MQADVSIGKIVATFGTRGEVLLSHVLGKKTDLSGTKAVFIEQVRGNPIPFFLSSAKAKSATELWLKVEGIDSKEAAAVLLQKQVWLTQKDFERHVAPTATLGLLGFAVYDKGKLLGKVQEVIEQKHQVLCLLYIQEKEVMIPLNEATLQKIDRRKQKIEVTLPDGLLEIYLS